MKEMNDEMRMLMKTDDRTGMNSQSTQHMLQYNMAAKKVHHFTDIFYHFQL